VLLEVPAGGIDRGESPEDAAQRELREEIGMRAGRLEPIAEFYVSPGFLTEYVYAFLATDLSDSPAEADDDEDIAVVRMPLAAAVAMAERGEFRDAKSIAGILVAARRLLS
jgi:ADP-ribose pyrophosphatase